MLFQTQEVLYQELSTEKQENIVISELNDLCLIAYELINFPVHEYQKIY